MDGQSYDYNGIGEYWLIKSSSLHLQGRTVPVRDANGKLAAASIFGAFAIQVPKTKEHDMSNRIFLQKTEENSKNFAP